MEDTMLAEIFMLRLEAETRFSKDLVSSAVRFVPFNRAAAVDLKNNSSRRRS